MLEIPFVNFVFALFSCWSFILICVLLLPFLPCQKYGDKNDIQGHLCNINLNTVNSFKHVRCSNAGFLSNYYDEALC